MQTLEMLVALSNVKAALGYLLISQADERNPPKVAVRCCLWIEDGELVGEYEVGHLGKRGDFEGESGGSL